MQAGGSTQRTGAPQEPQPIDVDQEGDFIPINQQGRSQKFSDAFSRLKSVLDGLSSKDRVSAMRALGGLYGLNVSFNPQIPIATGGRNLTVQRGALLPGNRQLGPRYFEDPEERRGQLRPTATVLPRNPEKQRFVEEVSKLNVEISSESKRLGQRLPPDHPLIQRRQDLFRRKAANQLGNLPQAP